MGVFSKMLNKLGIKSKEEKAAEKAAAAKPEVKPVIPRTTTVHANKPTAHESRPVASKLDVAGVDAKLSSVAAAAPACRLCSSCVCACHQQLLQLYRLEHHKSCHHRLQQACGHHHCLLRLHLPHCCCQLHQRLYQH